ncbi:MAG: tetratricopeptide repeat protein [Brevinema sp.]
MKLGLDQIMKFLMNKRTYVLAVLGGIVVLSLFAGIIYQRNMDKSAAAADIYDEAWQKVAFIAGEIQKQNNYTFLATDPTTAQIKTLFKEGMQSVDILITDYSGTISAARAAALYLSVIDVPYMMALLDDQELATRMRFSSYLDRVQKKHPKFWDALIDLAQGTRFEQKGQHDEAIELFKSALKKDNENYMNDYLLIAIARNYEIKNNSAEAVSYYQKVLKIKDSVWANFASAKVYTLSK